MQAQIIASSPAAYRQNIIVSSGADGAYQIERLAAGDYKVTALVGSGMGATTASKQAHVDPGKRAEIDIDVPLGDIALAVTVVPKGAGTIDLAQVALFAGKTSVANGRELNAAFLAAGDAGGVKFQLGPASAPIRFTELTAGSYSICVVPLTGDLQDPVFARRLQSQAEKLKVHCGPHDVAASPKEQTYTAAVPPMEPLE